MVLKIMIFYNLNFHLVLLTVYNTLTNNNDAITKGIYINDKI